MKNEYIIPLYYEKEILYNNVCKLVFYTSRTFDYCYAANFIFNNSMLVLLRDKNDIIFSDSLYRVLITKKYHDGVDLFLYIDENIKCIHETSIKEQSVEEFNNLIDLTYNYMNEPDNLPLSLIKTKPEPEIDTKSDDYAKNIRGKIFEKSFDIG